MNEIIGWVVLTNDAEAGFPPKWQPDWDGEIHTDRARADAEAADCLDGGHQCVLGEVRVTE